MKDLFNKKIFKEAFRQLKIPFCLFLGMALGISAIISFLNVYSAIDQYNLTYTTTFMDATEVYIFLIAAFLLIVPVFTFRLFSFLNKRNASDFYHTIPVKRKTLMFTYAVTILAATTMLMAIYTLIPTITFSLADKYIEFYFVEGIGIIINSFVCVILVLGLCMLSSSLTGTFFTNIVFLLLIAFGPRFLIFTITDAITSNLSELITYQPNFGFFSENINLLYGTVFSDFFYSWDFTIISLDWSTLYTLALGLVYIILAFVAYNKRKSEQAESSARNAIVQHVIRTGIGFVFCLIATLIFISAGEDETEYVITILLIYGFIAICGMVGFELISTKKFKSLINIFVSIPIIIVLCLIVTFSISMAEKNILSYEPNAKNIDAIKYKAGDMYYEDGNNYYTYMLSNTEFKNDELINTLVDLYNEQMVVYRDYYKNNSYRYFEETYGKYQTMVISFIDGNKETTRVIYMNDKEYNAVMSTIFDNENYKAIYQSLPEKYTIMYGNENFSDTQTKLILDTFEAELKELSYENILYAVDEYHYPDEYFFEFELRTILKGNSYYIPIRIGDFTPKTLNAIFDMYKESASEQSEDINYIKDTYEQLGEQFEDDYLPHYYLNIYAYNLNTKSIDFAYNFDEYYLTDFDWYELNCDSYEELEKSVLAFLNAGTDDAASDYLITLRLETTINTEYEEIYTHFYINDCEEFENLTSIFTRKYIY